MSNRIQLSKFRFTFILHHMRWPRQSHRTAACACSLYTATCLGMHVCAGPGAQCFHHGGSVSRRRSDGKPPVPVLE